jgi:hypothetical protein
MAPTTQPWIPPVPPHPHIVERAQRGVHAV